MHWKAARVAREAELEATRQRIAAEEKALASQAVVDKLRPPTVSHKRQKIAFGAQQCDDKEQAQSDISSSNENTIDENHLRRLPSVRGWTRWLESRAEPIDDNDMSEAYPPRGGDKRGWRYHIRRGVIGSLQDWANGSKYKVAFMLAEMTVHFNCIDLVSSRCLIFGV